MSRASVRYRRRKDRHGELIVDGGPMDKESGDSYTDDELSDEQVEDPAEQALGSSTSNNGKPVIGSGSGGAETLRSAVSASESRAAGRRVRQPTRRSQRNHRRPRHGDSDSEPDEIFIDPKDDKERRRIFWYMAIRYLVIFVVFLLLHQTVTKLFIDPWRGVEDPMNKRDRVLAELCPPGQPCNIDLPPDWGS